MWKTTSNGATFTPLLQTKGLLSIGDVTVSQQNPDVVWVGTGESNNRQTTSWGDGVWKSTDGGKTFANVGLKDSKHINRILIDPSNDDVVLVAAIGSIFGPGGDRGVYKTTDGGKTLEARAVRRRRDGRERSRDVVDRSEDDLRVDVPAPSLGVLRERRRPGQRNLEIDRRRRHVDAALERIARRTLGRIGLDTYRKNGNIVYASIEAQGPPGGRGGAWRRQSGER